jgi:hypothetical protein
MERPTHTLYLINGAVVNDHVGAIPTHYSDATGIWKVCYVGTNIYDDEGKTNG